MRVSKLTKFADKAPISAKDTSHIKFQEIAFAYAILSDERRRKRYDTTGNTSESLDDGEDDFNWVDFFRAQIAEAVTGERLNDFKSTYQNSEEEKQDVLKAYKAFSGRLNSIFKTVMLSNPLDDEERFRGYIDQAIQAGEAFPYMNYAHEKQGSKDARHHKARKEAKEAERHAKDSGIHESIFGPDVVKAKKSGKDDSGSALADLIQQRQKSRASNFLDDLETKYAGGNKGTAKTQRGNKRTREDEPPEEAFQKTADRIKTRKLDISIEEDDHDEEHTTEVSEAEEPESVKKGKSVKPKGKKNEEEKKPVTKRTIRAKTRKAPIVDEDDENEDLNTESSARDPEIAPKKTKPATARPSRQKKR